MVNCKDKVVLITGASSGIGEAIAKRFAALNASLLLTGIGQMDLDRVAQECKAIGSPKVWSFEINLSDRYTIDGLF
ncbi:MAG: SDR family NAD(P)-dependent oxidoreductase, partial [Bacteroidales bacterium]|nr:SDR family NAD(P)-dependent oxidoreductase [Bacteroidales bacterium]